MGKDIFNDKRGLVTAQGTLKTAARKAITIFYSLSVAYIALFMVCSYKFKLEPIAHELLVTSKDNRVFRNRAGHEMTVR